MDIIEHQILEAAAEALIAAGFQISVYNDTHLCEDSCELLRSEDVTEILKASGVSDSTVFLATSAELGQGWVWFVHGNGTDVLSDHTMNLEDILEPVNDLANNLYAA